MYKESNSTRQDKRGIKISIKSQLCFNIFKKIYFIQVKFSFYCYSTHSTIYSVFWIFTFMFYFCLFHIGLHFLQGCVKKISEDGKCKVIVKAIKWWFFQIYKFMNFRFYIRNILMLCQFILISSFYDIATFSRGGNYRIFSMLFAIFLLLFYISVTGVIIYLIFSKRQANARIIENLKELFSEVKELKRHKLHLAIFFIRRMVYTFWGSRLFEVDDNF